VDSVTFRKEKILLVLPIKGGANSVLHWNPALQIFVYIHYGKVSQSRPDFRREVYLLQGNPSGRCPRKEMRGKKGEPS